MRGRDLASAIDEAHRKVNDAQAGIKLPPGYRIVWSGEFAQMEQANKRLMWIVPVSIMLILCLLYTTFNSTKDALLVMCNVLEAAIGGVLALWLTGTPFSISAAVGFISIFGVAVQDGVLLISYFNQMRAEGMSVRESILRGAELRVRPVVMTSLTAALGLLPGRPGHLDRFAGPEAVGDRRGRGDALYALPDAIPDAGALQLLPCPEGSGD